MTISHYRLMVISCQAGFNSIPYDMGSRFYAMGYQAVLGADTLRRDAGAENVLNMCYVFDTPNPEAEAAAEDFLSALAAQKDSPLMYESKATHRAHFEEYRMTFAMSGRKASPGFWGGIAGRRHKKTV